MRGTGETGAHHESAIAADRWEYPELLRIFTIAGQVETSLGVPRFHIAPILS